MPLDGAAIVSAVTEQVFLQAYCGHGRQLLLLTATVGILKFENSATHPFRLAPHTANGAGRVRTNGGLNGPGFLNVEKKNREENREKQRTLQAMWSNASVNIAQVGSVKRYMAPSVGERPHQEHTALWEKELLVTAVHPIYLLKGVLKI